DRSGVAGIRRNARLTLAAGVAAARAVADVVRPAGCAGTAICLLIDADRLSGAAGDASQVARIRGRRAVLSRGAGVAGAREADLVLAAGRPVGLCRTEIGADRATGGARARSRVAGEARGIACGTRGAGPARAAVAVQVGAAGRSVGQGLPAVLAQLGPGRAVGEAAVARIRAVADRAADAAGAGARVAHLVAAAGCSVGHRVGAGGAARRAAGAGHRSLAAWIGWRTAARAADADGDARAGGADLVRTAGDAVERVSSRRAD